MGVKFIHCPNHKEETASFALYPDGGGYCFGCGFSAFAESLGVTELPKPTPVEDLYSKMGYIDSLPRKLIRGLMLPYDNTGYYIVWPRHDYYKKRLFEESKGKYRCPPGHKKPPFWVHVNPDLCTVLCIVEGELNALSLRRVGLYVDIVSPGGATEFIKFLPEYIGYDTIVIVADKDPAGTLAAIETKAALLQYTPNVRIVLVEEDFNSLLQKENGIEQIKITVGLSPPLPSGPKSLPTFGG